MTQPKPPAPPPGHETERPQNTREAPSGVREARRLQKEVETAVDRIRGATSETTVRRIVAEINGKIGAANAQSASGTATALAPLDPDEVVARWRAGRA